MALKIANTVVVNDSGNIVGEFGGLVVNNRLVFDDTRAFQGESFGYVAGGADPDTSTVVDDITKFPFASESTGTDVGELTQGRKLLFGQQSATDSYASSGDLSSNPQVVSNVNTVDKFPFANDTSATDVAEASTRRNATSASSRFFGYMAGGQTPTSPFRTNNISKFPFTSDSPSTSVGSLTYTRDQNTSSASSATHGYSVSGFTGTSSDAFDKWPFASDTNATDVGEMPFGRRAGSGASSSTHGYIVGGFGQRFPFSQNQSFTCIDKFPFSSDTPSSTIGGLTRCINGTGVSSTTSGYALGGGIDKFPFTSDTNASDVGELPGSADDTSSSSKAGTQV